MQQRMNPQLNSAVFSLGLLDSGRLASRASTSWALCAYNEGSMPNSILALDASEWQGRLSRQHLQYAYDMGVRLYIAQLWGSGPTGNGPNDYAEAQLGFAKEVGMAIAGYIWVPPDDTVVTDELVKVSLDVAGRFKDELAFVAPDLEGSRLHPTNPVGRLMDVCENLVLANKRIVIYCSKRSWPAVMGTGVTEFKQYPLWEARYCLKSGYKPDTPPDIDWAWSKFGGWQQRAILQYAGTAPVNGWGADWNVVVPDRLGLDSPTPPPPPKPPAPKPPAPPPPPPPPKPPANTRPYTVKATDTDGLSGIASRELGDANRWREIAALNPSVKAPRYIIHEGNVLLLPTGGAPKPPAPKPKPPAPKPPAPGPVPAGHYKVVSGDIAGLIAERFGLSWNQFVAMNPGKPRSGNWNKIYPGEIFKVVGAPAPKPRPPVIKARYVIVKSGDVAGNWFSSEAALLRLNPDFRTVAYAENGRVMRRFAKRSWGSIYPPERLRIA